MGLETALGIGGAVAGLLSNRENNRKQENTAKDQLGQQQQLIDRQTKLFDTLFGAASDADKSGAFDPEKQIDLLNRTTAKYESRDLGNLGGALSIAGYKPGDSEVGVRMDAVKGKYQLERENQESQIRRQSLFDRFNAYNSANGGMLNAGIGTAGQNADRAYSRMQNPANLFQSIIPFLEMKKKKQSGFKTGDVQGSGPMTLDY